MQSLLQKEHEHILFSLLQGNLSGDKVSDLANLFRQELEQQKKSSSQRLNTTRKRLPGVRIGKGVVNITIVKNTLHIELKDRETTVVKVFEDGTLGELTRRMITPSEIVELDEDGKIQIKNTTSIVKAKSKKPTMKAKSAIQLKTWL